MMKCLTLTLCMCSLIATQASLLAQENATSLLASAYEQTQTAATVGDYTAVIDLCQQAEAVDLSAVQTKYVRQLSSWAYNRRGEAYVEQAAEATESGATDQASQLDRRALADFEKSVEEDPTRWKAIHNRGVSLALANKYDESIDDFSSVIELRPEYPNAWFNRAEIRYELGRFDEAIEDYTKSLELNPDDFGAYTSRGHAYFGLQKFTAAIEDYSAAIELDADNATAFANRGDALQKIAKWKEAASDFRRSVELAPTLPRAYASAAWLMATCPDEKFRHAELSLQAAERAVELAAASGSDDSFELLDILAASQANAERFDDAVAALSKAIEIAPKSAASALSQRLDLYSNEQPFRLPRTQTAQASATELR